MNATSTTTILAAVEDARAQMLAMVNKSCDDLAAQINPVAKSGGDSFKKPTLQDGHDPRNKNGLNLTPRGVEILFRVFDDDGGYNRGAKFLKISPVAAKNRKAQWVKAGGKNRQKDALDIDPASRPYSPA
jgi:hypothetical protein